MRQEEKSWKNSEGELTFEFNSHSWIFVSGSRQIFINSWNGTDKGPMTEVVLMEGGKQKVIFEILEKNFNEEWFSPQNPDETAEQLILMCNTLMNIDTTVDEYQMGSSLISCITKMMKQLDMKCIHVYYGIGLFFGMTNKFGQFKRLNDIPGRSMQFPATRHDSFVD